MKRKPSQQEALLLFDNQTAPKAGSIIRKPGSRKLYILFTYFGRRVEKSTGLNDTTENREKVRKWLDRVIDLRDAGRLVFADAFPGARDEEKATFAKMEGWNYAPAPRDVRIGDYIDKWSQEVVQNFKSHIKVFDYQQIVNCWITPYFAEKTFFQLTRLELKKYITTLNCKIGPNKGKSLSRSRTSNIITVLRALFNDALDEYHWDLPDPFRNIERCFPTTPPQVREIFQFDEWQLILGAIDPWYRPMIEFMMLTGMIHSEISGLRRSDILASQITVQQSIVRKVESPTLKTKYRIRKLPITRRIRAILEEMLKRTSSHYVFAEPDGTPYLRENFVEDYWMPAVKSTGIPYRPPYSIRHSFAAWSLLVGIDPLRLVNLMGHGSKKMVFDVYGNYAEGLERDYWDILNYFGKDYVEVKRKPLPSHQNPHCESLCESQGSETRNQLITL